MRRGESSGRADDNEETIRKRMQVFWQESQPVIDALTVRGSCLVAQIDAQSDPDSVFSEVQLFMEQMMQSQAGKWAKITCLACVNQR